MQWQLRIRNYGVLEAALTEMSQDRHRYLAAYDQLDGLRWAIRDQKLDAAHLPSLAQCQLLLDALIVYGGDGDRFGQANPTLANPAGVAKVICSDEVLPSLAFLQSAVATGLLRLDDNGNYPHDPSTSDEPIEATVRQALWNVMLGGREVISRGKSPLYPIKVALLLTGAVVAPDIHVSAALRSLGIPGFAQAAALGVPEAQWHQADAPNSAFLRRMAHLVFVASNLWHSDPRYQSAVVKKLPQYRDAPGRVLDLLLMNTGRSGTAPSLFEVI
jgi:hypothetical protein